MMRTSCCLCAPVVQQRAATDVLNVLRCHLVATQDRQEGSWSCCAPKAGHRIVAAAGQFLQRFSEHRAPPFAVVAAAPEKHGLYDPKRRDAYHEHLSQVANFSLQCVAFL
jgi:hypothetical protein